jgi:hypothetical protein
MRGLIRPITVLSASVLAALPALADSLPPVGTHVTMTFNREGLGSSIKYTYDGVTETDFAGIYEWVGVAGNPAPLNSPFQSFCIDINQWFDTGPYDFTTRRLEDAPNPNPDNGNLGMGTARADDLRRLWAQDRAHVVDNISAAAFQVAIWEIVSEKTPTYGSPTLNVTSGSFYIDTSTQLGRDIAACATKFLGHASDTSLAGEPQLLAITSAQFQDQLVVMPVPLPVAAWGAAALLAGFGIFSRPTRR